MTSQRRNLAAFTLIIGILTLILAVSIFTEKAHEAHLPEQNNRGTAEAVVFTGVNAGILLLLSAVFGFVRNRNRYSSYTRIHSRFGQSSCPVGVYCFPMRWQYFTTPVQV